MILEREGRGSYACWLTPTEYRGLVATAPSFESRLCVRLAGEAGLRPVSVPEVKLSNVERIEGKPFVQVPNVRSRRGPEFRDVYLPESVLNDLELYADDQSIPPDEAVINWTKRTVQEKIKNAAREYAARTGESDYEYVSSADFRRYYIWKLLFEDRVHIRVVMELGGLDHLDSLETYLPFPTREEMFAELERISEVTEVDSIRT